MSFADSRHKPDAGVQNRSGHLAHSRDTRAMHHDGPSPRSRASVLRPSSAAKLTEIFQSTGADSVVLKPYDMVRIVSGRFADEGAPPGTIGFIVEKWEEGVFEVEVSRPDGATVALFSAKENELELVEPIPWGRHQNYRPQIRRPWRRCGNTEQTFLGPSTSAITSTSQLRLLPTRRAAPSFERNTRFGWVHRPTVINGWSSHHTL